LTIDIQCTYTGKEVIRVITEANETIPESFRKCLTNLPEKYIKQMQPASILSTACIIRKVNGIFHPISCINVRKGSSVIALFPLKPLPLMEEGGLDHDPAALLPGKRLNTNYTGGCVDPRAALYGCKKFRPHRDSIPGPSACIDFL
jgi:hypothetical protein